MKKTILTSLALLLLSTSVVSAQVNWRTFSRSILPLDATEDIGTTTTPWNGGYFNRICLGGVCNTVWPSGGGGGTGSGSISTSSAAVRGNLLYFTTSGSTPELVSNVATGTIAASGGLTVSAGAYIVGSNLTIGCSVASASQAGCLSTSDFSAFNNKAVYSFTPSTNFAVAVNATTGIPWFQNALHASGTSQFGNINIPITGTYQQGGDQILAGASSTGNLAVGIRALFFITSGTSNTGVGNFSLAGIQDGTNNVAIGNSSLLNVTSGIGNTGIGFQAGGSNSSNSYNVSIGYRSASIATGASNIIIGSNVQAPVQAGNRQLNIGNTIYGTSVYDASGGISSVPAGGKIGIGTTTPAEVLSVQGNGLFSGNVSMAGLTATGTINFTALTGTQCLHVISGVVSGTGSDCSAGAANAFSYLFPGNATTTPLTFASSTNAGTFLSGNYIASSTATSSFAGGIDAARVCITGTTKCLNNITNGTVTSVALTVPSFLSIGGSPITTNGTLAISLSGTALPIANGGTGLTAVGASSTVATTDGSIVKWNKLSVGQFTSANISQWTNDSGYLILSTLPFTYPFPAGATTTPLTFASSTNAGNFLSGSFLATSSAATSTFNSRVAHNATTTFNANTGFTIASSSAAAASYTVNWQSGVTQRFIVNQASSFIINATSSTPLDGGKYILKICQDAAGSRAVTFVTPEALRWPALSGTTTISQTANMCTWIGMIYDASSLKYSILASTTVPIN